MYLDYASMVCAFSVGLGEVDTKIVDIFFMSFRFSLLLLSFYFSVDYQLKNKQNPKKIFSKSAFSTTLVD